MNSKKPQDVPGASGSWVASSVREHAHGTTPAHVGECPVMVFHMTDCVWEIRQPWERFAVIDVELLRREMTQWIDGHAFELSDDDQRLRMSVSNAWAEYRRVGDDQD